MNHVAAKARKKRKFARRRLGYTFSITTGEAEADDDQKKEEHREFDRTTGHHDPYNTARGLRMIHSVASAPLGELHVAQKSNDMF